MAKSKNRASKADVQSTKGNRMPAPESDMESATELVYGTDENPADRSALGKQKRK